MIEFKQGNLLDEKTDALVNTVNCVGVMGKGIALQFKKAFPENFKQYKKACDRNAVEPGQMFTVDTGNLLAPRYIINFPTKRHWRGKSKLEDIQVGLIALVNEVQRLNIQSIAIPPLGCGNGGLDWAVVKPLIVEAFERLPAVRIILFEPGGGPTAEQMKVSVQQPQMTRGRALLIALLNRYGLPGYRLGKLEAQKLAYFLQEAGEPMKLRYEKHLYGPYADNLNHALLAMDGYYIKGYGDRQQRSQISVLPSAQAASEAFLAQESVANEHLDRVNQLIEGFETPYGMEMLATIHWVAKYDDPQARGHVEAAIAGVHGWSERKCALFKPRHLRKAWRRLYDQEWLSF